MYLAIKDTLNLMKVLFITSYGKEGFGHLVRCIAISQAFKKLKINYKFLINNEKNIFDNLKKSEIEASFDWYKEKHKTISVIKKFDIIILDSLKISKNFLIRIKNVSKFMVYINDYNRWKINGILHVDWTLLKKRRTNKLEILGHKYTPLRKDFIKSKNYKLNKKIKNIFIFFGGSDVRGLSNKTLNYLVKNHPDFNFKIISKKKEFKNVKYYNLLNAKKLIKILFKSDLVITSGGQTLYEIAYIGIPSIVFSETKYDSEDIKAWTKKGGILYSGQWNSKKFNLNLEKNFKIIQSYNFRKIMRKNMEKIIDGKGALRLAKKILFYEKFRKKS